MTATTFTPAPLPLFGPSAQCDAMEPGYPHSVERFERPASEWVFDTERNTPAHVWLECALCGQEFDA